MLCHAYESEIELEILRLKTFYNLLNDNSNMYL